LWPREPEPQFLTPAKPPPYGEGKGSEGASARGEGRLRVAARQGEGREVARRSRREVRLAAEEEDVVWEGRSGAARGERSEKNKRKARGKDNIG